MEYFCGNIENDGSVRKTLGRLAIKTGCFCLCGELGAGKTLLCREIAMAQG